MEIKLDDLNGPEIANLLDEHRETMKATTPPESAHALNLDELRHPDIAFWSLWIGNDIAGCGALKKLDSTHAEIKSMRTSKRHQRKGVAAKVLEYLILEAKQRGYKKLSLETGAMEYFLPARSLYAKSGFIVCGPFGNYVLDPNSVFMTMDL